LIVLELKTPYEVSFGSLANYSKLRVFDCSTYANIKEDKLGLRERKYDL
jgi:hypothetical protein